MNKRILQILVCPMCKGKLIYQKQKSELVCMFDHLAFPIKDGIPVMIINEARPLAQDNPTELDK